MTGGATGYPRERCRKPEEQQFRLGRAGEHVFMAEFAHPVERELARLFDEHGIQWEYEPHTFVLERDEDGTVREAFTPDFLLPDLGIYVECTVMRQRLTNRKRRKARKVKERTGVEVALLFRRDLEGLARRRSIDGLLPHRQIPSGRAARRSGEGVSSSR